MYDDTLAATGAGALIIGGHAIGLPAIVTVGAMLIVAGLLTYRIATRSRRG